ncbi:5' nucleotidase, NT5C type [Mucilaginibacter phyllosphaerae]|uniref:5'(3')-deoxyribonucleotidase n=1 Tax=Mucilaginibacter phyllosphaerae TaxID=1812349 RepID=A0A4Y8ADR5_9SPHI|nr:5'(3')-deoxyribonucleotidase [Mucilaginibacter phyllosphaerae]MBB3970382.1 5'(3')-deoxyribonucleotidase [Mucilaginibacter phyllosphaerae]TEW66748.1 5'(3')-deoxyribonucleotidase [Mucilaginibacter phyllosphaerae]GGH11660.1 5'-3'-deoxyribonucleotidase [Mucilaginibacter phyllosphaerae]
MKRIAIDMDEVVADAIGRFAEWYKRDYGIEFTAKQLNTTPFENLIDPTHNGFIKAAVYHDDFFKDLAVIPGCKEVIKDLYQHYELFFTTAAMEFPNSLLPKLAWLGEHFPYILWTNIVFCGDKSIINADYLIDDNVKHFKRFIGQGILFTASHNHDVQWDVRVNNWQQIRELLL